MKLSLIALVFAASLALCASAEAKDAPQKGKKKKEVAPKVHACSSVCKGDKHFYLHGEKGHVCGKECERMLESFRLKIVAEKQDGC